MDSRCRWISFFYVSFVRIVVIRMWEVHSWAYHDRCNLWVCLHQGLLKELCIVSVTELFLEGVEQNTYVLVGL
jgi:hypothetical protein